MADHIPIIRDCGVCGGDGTVPNGYYDIGGNWIESEPVSCSACGGVGFDKPYYIHSDLQEQLDDMQDKINAILNKCNDIFEKINE